MKIIVRHYTTKDLHVFNSIKEVLEDINRDRSSSWWDYTYKDWKEGLQEFTEWELVGKGK